MKLNISVNIDIVNEFESIDTVARVYYPNEGNKIQLIKGLNKLEFTEYLLHEIGHLFDWYISNGNQSDVVDIREKNAELLQFINKQNDEI